MDLLWAIPPLAVTVGAVLALVQLRGIADATADLGVELHRFCEVRVAVNDVRAASAEARASLARLHRA